MSTTSTALVQSSPQMLITRSTSTTMTTSGSSPGTPAAKTTGTPPVEAKPSPGNFRHPRLSEIIQRQSKGTLTERGIRSAAYNGLALILSLVIGSYIHPGLHFLFHLASLELPSYIIPWMLFGARILLIGNILRALRPILPYTKPTTYDDIPLTPSQRKLLGLPPSTARTATPGTPDSTKSFITPPRYTRRLSSSSPSPSNQLDLSADRHSISANYSSSPLSTSRHTLGFSPSPNTSMSTYRRTASGSPFTPSASIAGSPLFHKAIHNRDHATPIPDLTFDVSSRTSTLALTGSPLGRSQSVKERGSGSRSPVRRRQEDNEKRSPVQKGVNYKWLYDKGFGLGGNGGLSRSESMGF